MFASVPTVNDSSGTIASGGVAQTLLAVNNSRRGWDFQNLSAGDLHIRQGANASAGPGSLRVPPGAHYECPPGASAPQTVSVFGATTGQAFTCRWW